MRALLAGALLVLAQEKAREDAPERIILTDRTELRGRLVRHDATGLLHVREAEGGRVLRIPVEEVLRVQFGSDEAVQVPPGGERFRLAHGGSLTGRVREWRAGAGVIETPAGAFRVRRADIKAVVLAPLTGAPPEIKEERKDVLIRELPRPDPAKGSPEYAAEYGELVAIGEKVAFRPSPGAPEKEFPRAEVRQIYIHQESDAADAPAGWFAKVLFRNGDRLVGVLRSVDADRVRLFSHLFGDAEIGKAWIHSIHFVPHARMTVGNLLVCDQGGVRELDRQGRAIWTYGNAAEFSMSARKLDNGHVLIANTQYNQVIEVKPSGKSGGEIVWRLENLSNPYDAVRLGNGNTLVAEYNLSRVVEYDARTKNAVWQASVDYPISVQRLENGNTLVCSIYRVVEIDREGKEKWKSAPGRGRPWRAQRLDNGNTLITDQRGQVLEVDPNHNEVWKLEGLLRPLQALRLEDGNTLILEQGQNRILEVDPSKRPVNTITGLNNPQGMSTY